MDNLDSVLRDIEERENLTTQNPQEPTQISDDQVVYNQTTISNVSNNRVLVGQIEHFFNKINVAAIKLSAQLRLGDTIEIESADQTLRLRISSMQIDKKDVTSASEGDSIGIKVDQIVTSGSKVYLID